MEMVDRDGAFSISRQCALLGISRSSVYYTPRGESAESLALMRRMDALSLEYPFYGSQQMARHLRDGPALLLAHRALPPDDRLDAFFLLRPPTGIVTCFSVRRTDGR